MVNPVKNMVNFTTFLAGMERSISFTRFLATFITQKKMLNFGGLNLFFKKFYLKTV